MQWANVTPSMKFSEAAENWLASRTLNIKQGHARFVADGTLVSYAEYIRALNRFFSALPLDHIHLGHLRVYQEQRAGGELGAPRDVVLARCAKQQHTTVEGLRADPVLWAWTERKLAIARRPVNPNKINQETALLVAILKRAGLWTEKQEQSFERLQAEERDVPRAMTPEEQLRLLITASSHEEWGPVYWFTLLALRSTATNVEMRNLRCGDINLGHGTLYVRAATAKNKFRVRTIPLAPDARWAAQRLLDRAAELGSRSPEQYVFPFGERRGEYDPTRPMTVSGLKRPWGELRSAAALPWLRIHDLRHTAITRLAEAGTPLAVIMSMAGHISPRMTQHYTQISAQAQRLAVEAAYSGTLYSFGERKPVQKESPPLHVNHQVAANSTVYKR